MLDSCSHSITHTHTSLRTFCIQRCFAGLRWQHAEAWPLLTAVERLPRWQSHPVDAIQWQRSGCDQSCSCDICWLSLLCSSHCMHVAVKSAG